MVVHLAVLIRCTGQAPECRREFCMLSSPSQEGGSMRFQCAFVHHLESAKSGHAPFGDMKFVLPPTGVVA